MQVIIPIDDSSGSKSTLSKGFHTTEMLCLYNTDTDQCEWFDAEAFRRYSGDITSGLKQMGISAVITNEISFMALGVFSYGGLTVYQSKGFDLFENIELLKANQLELFTIHQAFKKSSCGGACSSCESATCKN
jgi:predicted Fe-Mo cluster-binding NifX family protein